MSKDDSKLPTIEVLTINEVNGDIDIHKVESDEWTYNGFQNVYEFSLHGKEVALFSREVIHSIKL